MSPSQAAALEQYAQLLADSPINLVSRGDRGVVRTRHIDEAVALTTALAPPPGSTVLDLGSGGGLPGVVLGVLRPDIDVVCLDATRKKVAFIQRVAGLLELANVSAIAARAEHAARNERHRGRYDTVVSRALGRLSVVAELARGFLRPQGTLTVVKGDRYRTEWEGLHRVREPLAYGPPSRTRLRPEADTWVITIRALGPPPDAVPRPDGIPQRQPLETP